MKNFLKNKMLKRTLLGLSLAIMMVGGVFVYQAMAANPVTPATGGTNISIDTTSSGGTDTGTALGNIIIQENAVGDIAAGVHTLTIPDGWNFTADYVTLAVGGATNLTVGNVSINSTNGTTLSFNVTNISTTSVATLTFSGIKVHPTGTTPPATGNITMTTGTITGVDNGSTNFGTLTAIPGAVTKLAVTTQPTDTVYGSAISSVIINTQDKFGNNSISGLAASNNVTLTLSSGTGAIVGTAVFDIGTDGENGTTTYSGLQIDTAGTGKVFTATAASTYSPITSSSFDITPKALTVTGITGVNRDYDGGTTATLNTGAATSSDIISGDVVTIDVSLASGNFVDQNWGVSKTINVTGVDKTGADAANYTITQPTTTATISQKAVTISAITNTKEYDGLLTATAIPTDSGLAAGDTGIYTEAYTDKNFGSGNKTLAPTIVSIKDAGLVDMTSNYAINLANFTAGTIDKKALTVSAITNTRDYNGLLTAAAIPTDGGGLVAGDTGIYTEAYTDKNASTSNRTLTPTVVSIKDAGLVDMTGNYTITPVDFTTGTINTAAVTVTGVTDTKTYDGGVTSAGSPTVGALVDGDVVDVVPTQTYDDKNYGTTHVLTPAGLTIKDVGNADMTGNYTITYTPSDGVGTINTAAVTVTGVTDTKTYDGGVTSSASSTVGALVGTDIVNTAPIQTYDNKNYGTTHVLTPAGLTINDALAADMTGNYTITYTPSAGVGVINKAAVTVTADSGQTKVYGENDPTFTSTTSPALISGDSFTGALDRVAGENVGTTYAIGQGNLANTNYAITFVSANFAITAKPITVTPTAGQTKVYGATDPTFAYITAPALIGNDSLSGVLDRAPGETVGAYAIGLGDLANPNYTINLFPINFAITKATPVITWNNPSDIAAGTALSGTQLNATSTGVAGALAGTFVYTPASGYDGLTTVGTETLSTVFTPTDTINYNSPISTTTSINIIPAAAAKLALSASPASLAMGANSTLTVTVQDTYDNTVTSDNSTVVKLRADNSGAFPAGKTQLTVVAGIATTTLTKSSGGIVNVDVDSGALISPSPLLVTFTSTADETAPTISAISTSTTQTTAAITFTANENGQGKVAYSVSGVTPIATNYVSLASGTPKIINLANLVCNTTYNYTIYAKDGSNNEATSADDTFTTSACTATVIPTITLIGTTTVSAYTATEAAARFGSGLQFTTANATSTTVNGTVVTSTTTLTAVSSSSAQTLGAHTYNVIVTSTTGHTANMTISYQVNADGATDAAIPTIEDFGPNNNDTGVALNRYVFILFDEVMDRNTCLNANVHLWKTSGTSTEVAIDNVECSAPFILNGVEKTAMYITPTSNLSASTTYSLVIDNTVTAQYGTHFAGLSVGTYSFTTEPDAGLTADVVGLTHAGVTNGTWGNNGSYGDEDAGAYEWIFAVTLPSSEAFLSLQFADWSNGLGVASTTMRYWSEEIDHAALGGRDVPVSITAASTYPAGVEITGDNSSDAGIQTNVHVQLQIPGATPAGSHSTTFKVQSDTQ